MAKKDYRTHWQKAFGEGFNPIEDVGYKAFSSSSSEEVEEAMAMVLEACKNDHYSYELIVKQCGRYVVVKLIARRYWWAREGDLLDDVDIWAPEVIKCPNKKEYKAFKK